MIALTFDDGPDPVWTPRLLDLLADLGAHATFFVIASRAAQRPDLIARMTDERHSIGAHCAEHRGHPSRGSTCGRNDARRSLASLRAMDACPRLWRTPAGELAWWTGQVAREQPLRLVHWTVDTHDWRGDTAQQMFAATRDRLKDGAIVLAHDGMGPGARRTDAEQTLGFVALGAEQAHVAGIELGALA